MPNRRFTTLPASQPRIREAEDGSESRTILVDVALFGVQSEIICDWYERFREILEPGCITREMLDGCDIKMTYCHDRQKLLARSNNGQGTLRYTVDETGVHAEFEAPKTALGDEMLELVRRGDIAGASFAYSTDEREHSTAVSYSETDEQDGLGRSILLRHVWRVERVYDFTLAIDPAYQQTSVETREAVEASLGHRIGEPALSAEDEARKAEEAAAKQREIDAQVAEMRQASKRYEY